MGWSEYIKQNNFYFWPNHHTIKCEPTGSGNIGIHLIWRNHKLTCRLDLHELKQIEWNYLNNANTLHPDTT